MTGDGGLDGGAGGVAVANLADHDDVRVKTEDGTETFGEGAASGGVDGDLGDAGDAVFNRILKGDNFAVGGVEGVDDGIEGGGFTGAGGTDHEDEAAGVRDDFLDGGHFAFGETEEVEIQEGFVKVEETEDGVLAVHGGDSFNADVQEVGGTVAVDVLLHVAGLGGVGGGGDVGAGGELAHDDAVTVAVKVGDGVEQAVHAHTDADFVAEIFNVDIGGAEFVGLVNQEVKDFVGGNGIQGAADGGDGFGVAGFGNFDVVVVDFLGRVVAGDEGLEGGVGDEEEADVEAFVRITLAHFGEQAVGGLRGNHEAIRGVFVALLERNHKVLAHFGGGHNVRDEGDGVFKTAGIKVGQPQDARPVAGGLLFVLSAFALDFGFVHGLMWLRGVWARGCGYV